MVREGRDAEVLGRYFQCTGHLMIASCYVWYFQCHQRIYVHISTPPLPALAPDEGKDESQRGEREEQIPIPIPILINKIKEFGTADANC